MKTDAVCSSSHTHRRSRHFSQNQNTLSEVLHFTGTMKTPALEAETQILQVDLKTLSHICGLEKASIYIYIYQTCHIKRPVPLIPLTLLLAYGIGFQIRVKPCSYTTVTGSYPVRKHEFFSHFVPYFKNSNIYNKNMGWLTYQIWNTYWVKGGVLNSMTPGLAVETFSGCQGLPNNVTLN